MTFEEDEELLKQGEVDQQKAIDSYNNYDLKSPSSASSASSASKKVSVEAIEAKQLRQNEEDGLRSGDVTEDDHGKKFISDDDDGFFKVLTQEKKKKKSEATTMEAQRELLQRDDPYEEYDGSTATMETFEEEFEESTFAAEEVSYAEEFTDYRGDDVSTMYG
mmetsp:Transcript_41815/g.75307  ORF Transcript_41815/g.75307 Transcript_41815/m.75307 type:complete len:163 (-) Transcript_41815:55-543(-)|eukprot:CAMPEP_0201882180 /NCGR_PEP_ID=MMETSP0902-20130614/13484_1 /ASSEMBLY_ACC=CAM_ASM_000551 /TAXON_ID=420261 /ORGANISM="Thalassiosira antarctica, Strain CCMP982" /LENGTH=162 /DNA_ID=CAMNT_0048410599 /DNA_START=46 /DNA_END=534 /DNA_ORIENTATION=+